MFFVLLFSINIIFLYLALNSHRGLIEKNPYEKGLAYQVQIDASERALKSGIQVEFSAGPANEKGIRKTEVRVLSSDTSPLQGVEVSLEAKRPSVAGYDVSTKLLEKETTPGTYEADLILPYSGLWLVSLRVEQEGVTYLWRRKEYLD